LLIVLFLTTCFQWKLLISRSFLIRTFFKWKLLTSNHSCSYFFWQHIFYENFLYLNHSWSLFFNQHVLLWTFNITIIIDLTGFIFVSFYSGLNFMITGNLKIAERLVLMYLLQLMQGMSIKIKYYRNSNAISVDDQRLPKYW
jgi:hypothetical protein